MEESEKLDKVESYRIIIDSVKNVVTTDIIFALDSHASLGLREQELSPDFCFPVKDFNPKLLNFKKFKITDTDMQADIQDAILNVYVEKFLNFLKTLHQKEYTFVDAGIEEYESFIFNTDNLFLFFGSDTREHISTQKHISIKKNNIAVDMTHCMLRLTSSFAIPFSFRHLCCCLCKGCLYENSCKNAEKKISCYDCYDCCLNKFYLDDHSIFENFLYNEHIEKLLKRFNNADFRRKIEKKGKKINIKTYSEKSSEKDFQNKDIIDVLRMPVDYDIIDDDFQQYQYEEKKPVIHESEPEPEFDSDVEEIPF